MSANNRSEYIPDTDSKASEASRKAWDTAREQAVEKIKARTLTILGCRRTVVTDKKLSMPARLLFVWLLDLSLWKEVNTSDGAVAVSGAQLCQELGCCFDSLTRWKKELLWPRYIWISEVRRRGHWNSHLFHISALDPQEQYLAQKTVDGILRADGPDRPAPTPPRKRPNDHARRPIYLVDENGFSEPLGNQGDASEIQSGPLCSMDAPAPSISSGPLRQSERPAPSNWDGPLRQTGTDRSVNQHGPLRQSERAAPSNLAVPLRETGDLRESPVNSESGSILEAVNRVIAQEGGEGKTEGGHNWHDENSENDFLALCREVMGRSEVDDQPGGKKGNGGLWRANFRRQGCRALCWQVLRNARVKKNEGFSPDTTWAQYVVNDWIRMAGQKARE